MTSKIVSKIPLACQKELNRWRVGGGLEIWRNRGHFFFFNSVKAKKFNDPLLKFNEIGLVKTNKKKN